MKEVTIPLRPYWISSSGMTGMAMSDDDVGVGLAEALATVRTEFEQAIASGEGVRPGLPGGTRGDEFQVSFSRTGGEAGIKAWVVTVGAKGGPPPPPIASLH